MLAPLTANIASANEDINFNKKLNNILNDNQLAGITWATINNGSAATGSTGYSHLATLTPMSDTNQVHVGSVTKVLIAIGVLRLVSQEKLALDTKITTLLPKLAIINPWKNSTPITIKHLLEHTAGLDNIRMWQFLNTSVKPMSALSQAFLTTDKSLLTIRSKPGSQYSYSNMGYTLLGMVIEQVVNQHYETYLDNSLLAPLEMTNSTFLFTTQTNTYQENSLAMGYVENNVEQAAVALSLRPAGQFTTTALDMVKFSTLLLGNGQYQGKEFIDTELMSFLGYPSATDAADAGLNIGHGLALAGRDRHNVFSLCHPGTTFGFRAYFCIFPEQKKSFFYAINTDNDSANYEQFNQAFIDKLTVKKNLVQKSEHKVFDFSEIQGVYIDAPNNMAQFSWLDLVFNFKYLTWQEDHLLLSSLQSKDRKLIPLTYNSFRATDRNMTSHVIVRNENGNVVFSDGLHTYKKYSLIKVLLLWLSLLSGLIALVSTLVIGLYKLVRQRFVQKNILFWPFINIIAFALPAVAYSQQHFLQFGDITIASLSLAIISGVLPLSIVMPSLLSKVKISSSNGSAGEYLLLIILLQWWLVLFYWQMLPAIFWA